MHASSLFKEVVSVFRKALEDLKINLQLKPSLLRRLLPNHSVTRDHILKLAILETPILDGKIYDHRPRQRTFGFSESLLEAFHVHWMRRGLAVETQELMASLFLIHEFNHIPQNVDSDVYDQTHLATDHFFEPLDYAADSAAVEFLYRFGATEKDSLDLDLLGKILRAQLHAGSVFGRLEDQGMPPEKGGGLISGGRLRRQIVWLFQLARSRDFSAGRKFSSFHLSREVDVEVLPLLAQGPGADLCVQKNVVQLDQLVPPLQLRFRWGNKVFDYDLRIQNQTRALCEALFNDRFDQSDEVFRALFNYRPELTGGSRSASVVIKPFRNNHESGRTFRLGLLLREDWATSKFQQALLAGIHLALERVHPKRTDLKFELLNARICRPDEASVRQEVTALSKTDALAIVGPMDSETAHILLKSKLLDELQIPVLSPGASVPFGLTPEFVSQYFFRCTSSDRENLADLANWMRELDLRTPILPVVEQSIGFVPSYGEALWACFRGIALHENLALAPEIRFPRGNPSAAFPELTRLMGRPISRNKPLRVVLFGYSADVVRLCHAIRVHDSNAQLFMINPQRHLFLADGLRTSKNPLNGLRAVIDTSAEFPDRADSALFAEQYRLRFAHNDIVGMVGAAMSGADTVEILRSRVELILRESPSLARLDTARFRRLLQEALCRPHMADCFLSMGIFTEDRELPIRTERFVLQRNEFRRVKFGGV